MTNEDRRKKLDPSHDPLHNPGSNNGTNSRAVYLDAERRRALKEDYGVEPFTVHQFMGEALFIPAGSPRQVGDNFISDHLILHLEFILHMGVRQNCGRKY